LSLKTRRELTARWRSDYIDASKSGKREILDLLCRETGWNRKHAIVALKELPEEKPKQKRKRKRKYGPNEEAALAKVWRLSDYLASKRLAPFIEEFLEALERHDELRLPEPTRSRLVQMSASTVDRLLKRHRHTRPKPAHATKPGTLLRHQVAVRRGTDWDDSVPGFCEADTVSHCGGDPHEGCFFTLSLTDVFTGWTECAVIRSKGQQEALTALKSIGFRLPFPVLGLDIDNGSEFMNWHLMKHCQDNGIVFTRCRPYIKNDQCRIEQKNSSVVRRHTGYGRYETDAEFKLLMKIHGLLRLLVNFFEPSLKGKERAMTPYKRLLASNVLQEKRRSDLEEAYLALNPVALRRELMKAKMELLKLESLVSFLNEATV
jgi:hypothetical protein